MMLLHGPPPFPAEHGRRVDQQDPLDYRIAREPDPGEGGGPQGFHRAVGTSRDGEGLLPHAGLDVFGHRLEQGFLARKVVVQRAPADPRLAQYRLDRGVFVAALGKQPPGDRDQLAARRLAAGDVLVRSVHLRFPPCPGYRTQLTG